MCWGLTCRERYGRPLCLSLASATRVRSLYLLKGGFCLCVGVGSEGLGCGRVDSVRGGVHLAGFEGGHGWLDWAGWYGGACKHSVTMSEQVASTHRSVAAMMHPRARRACPQQGGWECRRGCLPESAHGTARAQVTATVMLVWPPQWGASCVEGVVRLALWTAAAGMPRRLCDETSPMPHGTATVPEASSHMGVPCVGAGAIEALWAA